MVTSNKQVLELSISFLSRYYMQPKLKFGIANVNRLQLSN